MQLVYDDKTNGMILRHVLGESADASRELREGKQKLAVDSSTWLTGIAEYAFDVQKKFCTARCFHREHEASHPSRGGGNALSLSDFATLTFKAVKGLNFLGADKAYPAIALPPFTQSFESEDGRKDR